MYTESPAPRRVRRATASLDLLAAHDLHPVVGPVVGLRHQHGLVGLVLHHVHVSAGMQGVHSAIEMDLLAVTELQRGVSLRLVHEYLHGGGLQVLHHVRGSAVHVLLSVARDV